MAPQPKKGILNIKSYKAGSSKANGNKSIIKLSSNESPFGASPKAIAAYKENADNLHRYPESSAAELREAIGEVYNLNPEQIICGAGSDEIISLLCNAYAGEGDEVLYSEHGFLMYPISAMAAGAMPVKANENNLTANVDNILKAVTEKTKIVFLANPNNPTGTYITKEELLRLRRGLLANVLLVLDGAYAEYMSADDYSAGSDIVDLGENTVMTRTFSKIYGLASLRLGWAYCPKPIIDVLNRVRGPFNVSSPAIKAGVAAVKDIDFVKKARIHNDKSLSEIEHKINNINGIKFHKSYGNFYLVEFNKEDNSAEDANKFLLESGIITRDMTSYGLPNYLRITVGMDDDNQAVIECLEEFSK